MLTEATLRWEKLTPEEFEQLVFFVLDDMGFKSLEWRKGGEGITATDGGRDLEATYSKLEPDDSLTIEKWWIEVKYRTHALSPDVVQRTILNAIGRQSVDVIAIATNQVITNKALDWTKDLQTTQRRPRIVIWQRHDLDRILRKYPRTVAKFFPESLTLAGRLEATEERFWNTVTFPTLGDIVEFWERFHELEWNSSNLLPIIVAEASAGNVDARQWGLLLDDVLLLGSLVHSLANIPPLVLRFEQYGRSNAPLISGVTYLLEMALFRLGLDMVVSSIKNPYQFMNVDVNPPAEVLDSILRPVLGNMYQDLGINCSKDCSKSVDSGSKQRHREATFFERFIKRESVNDKEPSVVIQLAEFECTLGIVAKGEYCPLVDDIPGNCGEETALTKLLGFAQQVIRARVAKN